MAKNKKKKQKAKKIDEKDRTTKEMEKDGYYELINRRELWALAKTKPIGTYLGKLPRDMFNELKKVLRGKIYEYIPPLNLGMLREIAWLVENYDIRLAVYNERNMNIVIYDTMRNIHEFTEINDVVLNMYFQDYCLIKINTCSVWIYKGKFYSWKIKFAKIKFYIKEKRTERKSYIRWLIGRYYCNQILRYNIHYGIDLILFMLCIILVIIFMCLLINKILKSIYNSDSNDVSSKSILAGM